MEPVPAQPTVGLDDFLLMENKCKIAILKVQSLENDLKLKNDQLQVSQNEAKHCKSEKKAL